MKNKFAHKKPYFIFRSILLKNEIRHCKNSYQKNFFLITLSSQKQIIATLQNMILVYGHTKHVVINEKSPYYQ